MANYEPGDTLACVFPMWVRPVEPKNQRTGTGGDSSDVFFAKEPPKQALSQRCVKPKVLARLDERRYSIRKYIYLIETRGPPQKI